MTFNTSHGKFNFRVGAVIINDNRLLITKKKHQPYYYLPGGRVKLYETAEQAIRRELNEEIGECYNVDRPLWFAQSFFSESVHDEKFHEICLYYLVNVTPESDLLEGIIFNKIENNQEYIYQWCPLSEISDYPIFPKIIISRICKLPKTLEIVNCNTISN